MGSQSRKQVKVGYIDNKEKKMLKIHKGDKEKKMRENMHKEIILTGKKLIFWLTKEFSILFIRFFNSF